MTDIERQKNTIVQLIEEKSIMRDNIFTWIGFFNEQTPEEYIVDSEDDSIVAVVLSNESLEALRHIAESTVKYEIEKPDNPKKMKFKKP